MAHSENLNGMQLAAMDVPARITRLRDRFDELGIDAMFVTNLTNIYYLTGFTGSAAMLCVTRDAVTFTTDGRYGIQSEAQLRENSVLDAHGVSLTIGGVPQQKAAIIDALTQSGRIGLESTNVSWDQLNRFQDSWFPTKQLVPLPNAIEDQRKVKDQGEIDRIERACDIADEALAAVAPQLKDGPTEREFALALDFQMRKLGADDISFDTIVAAGLNGARAHHQPSNHQITRGELVVIDFGALVDGYHSDMTRTLCVGEPSGKTQQTMFEVVQESQARGVQAVRAGVSCGDVDEVCRSYIAEHNWVDAFSHSTGHGVGLDIHEYPAVAKSVEDTLVKGQVVTVEPGVYLADHGGVRIEDTVVVTDDGCRVLTKAPKDLIVA